MICKRTAIPVDCEFETREAEDKKYIDAYFSVFNSEYPLFENAIEVVDEGAFNLERDTDVRALTNHDTTLVLGRTTAGTLELRTDEKGLWGRIEINENDQDAVNLYERVKRRDVSQCSFGFDILAEEIEHRDDGVTVWHLKSVLLYVVSICHCLFGPRQMDITDFGLVRICAFCLQPFGVGSQSLQQLRLPY